MELPPRLGDRGRAIVLQEVFQARKLHFLGTLWAVKGEEKGKNKKEGQKTK